MKNKVIVAGSINMDIVAISEKHPKVGETVIGTDLKYFPGGKGANQAVASARTSTETVMVGSVGGDDFGKRLMSFLSDEGVTLSVDVKTSVPSGTAIIVVSSTTSDNSIVVVPGANYTVDKKHVDEIEMNQGDILVSQFEIPTDTVEYFFKKGKSMGCKTILNPAPAKLCSKELLRLTDILVVNETELEFFAGKELDASDDRLITETAKGMRIREDQIIITTLGKNGVHILTGEKVFRTAGHKVVSVDTTGAGDCFVGTLASSLSRNHSIQDAVYFANAAAALSVMNEGASPSMPSDKEITSFISEKKSS